MNVVAELVRFLLRLAVGVLTALAVALLWALARGGAFADALAIACLLVGGLTLLLAAAGGSPSRRDASSASWMEKWAYRGTFADNRAQLPDTRLSTGALLALVGICLIALGVVLG